MPITMMDAHGAAAEAFCLARIQVFASHGSAACGSLADRLGLHLKFCDAATRIMPVESPQTALICAVGAQLAGQRAATFATSNDLEHLREALSVASGLRAPVVMPVFNQPLAEPWGQWGEYIDVMSARDSGWLQLYAENCQELMDLCLAAINVAERPEVRLPAMVCLNDFYSPGDLEPVDVPLPGLLDGFLQPISEEECEPEDETGCGAPFDSADNEYTGIRYRQRLGFEAAGGFLPQVMIDYRRRIGHNMRPFETYRMEGAQAVLVAMGTCGTLIKSVVDILRDEGCPVGFLRLISYRPFPGEELTEALKQVKHVGVLDHSAGLGGVAGPLCTDLQAAVGAYGESASLTPFLAGLGGRRIDASTITEIYDYLLSGRQSREPLWMDYQAETPSSYITGLEPENQAQGDPQGPKN